MHRGTQFFIYTFEVNTADFVIGSHRTIKVEGDITCLAIGPGYIALVGIWRAGQAFLGKVRLKSTGDHETLETIDLVNISEGKSPILAPPWHSTTARTIGVLSTMSLTFCSPVERGY